MALEEYLNLLLENPNFFNLLIVKNFLANGLQKVDMEEAIIMDHSVDKFDHPEIALKAYSRGTLINPINFINEESLKQANTTPNNKSTQENEEDEDDYNYDGYNPFSSGNKK